MATSGDEYNHFDPVLRVEYGPYFEGIDKDYYFKCSFCSIKYRYKMKYCRKCGSKLKFRHDFNHVLYRPVEKKEENIKVEKIEENIKVEKKEENIKVEKQEENIKVEKKEENIRVKIEDCDELDKIININKKQKLEK
eukprot:GHVL01023469.1.p1 GENE.GHVL01023469.1~~GHVL01023469.1.p1  ORF type:complete len:148 (+),score=35.47 GHVL01023469.1:35-445(+)